MPFASGVYTKFKDFVNGGDLLPSDLDSIQTDLGDQIASVSVAGGFNGGGVRRGKSIIAAAGTRTNVAYGALSNGPDQVANVVFEQDGLLTVGFQAIWQESVAGAARAAIFLNANQLVAGFAGVNAPLAQEAPMYSGGVAGRDQILSSIAQGLGGTRIAGPSGNYTGDATTGQVLGGGYGDNGQTESPRGWGTCTIFAAAGTYTVSVQFKASSGTVTVKNRRLWVKTEGF